MNAAIFCNKPKEMQKLKTKSFVSFCAKALSKLILNFIKKCTK